MGTPPADLSMDFDDLQMPDYVNSTFLGTYNPASNIPPSLDNTTYASVKPRKPKAPTLREADWEPHKARIIELHISEKRPLKEVKQIMEAESDFCAEYVSALRS
jgi:hypothetical protein